MTALRGYQGRTWAPRIGLFGLLALCGAVIWTGLPHSVNGNAVMVCIRPGFYPLTYKKLDPPHPAWRGYFESDERVWTIGAKLFNNELSTAQYSGPRGNFEDTHLFDNVTKQHCNVTPITGVPVGVAPKPYPGVNYCPHQFAWRTYTVNETFGTSSRILNGWLHVEFEVTDKHDEIIWASIHMKDENFNAVGEFVADERDQCASSNATKFVRPTPYQMLPCSAIGAREVKTAQGLYVVKKKYLFNKDQANADRILGAGQDLSQGIHFTWRFSEYWCSKHELIRPEAFLITKKQLELYDDNPNLTRYVLYRKAAEYWMKPNWFGAADIRKFPQSKLDCTNLAYSEDNGTVYENSKWIGGTQAYTFETDSYAEGNKITGPGWATYKSCQVKLNRGENARTFGGRCSDLLRPGANNTVLHTCNQDLKLNTTVKFQNYSTYVNLLRANRSEQCNVTCRSPTRADLDSIKKNHQYPPGYHGYTGPSRVNLTKSNASVARYQRGRKFHGILCIVCTMFFMPVSIFAARFYKETFMRYQVKSIHVWYWIHIGTTVASLAMYLSAWSALLEGIGLWGRSTTTAGTCHYILGWISNIIFTTMALIGGFRLGAGTASKLPRLAVMTLHSVFGFLTYLMNIFLVLNSTAIPESPSLGKCDDHSGMPVGLISPVGGLMLLWVLVDIFFHTLLTVLQFWTDKSMSIRRRWMCPIIPILPPTSRDDMKGSALRKIFFLIYVVLSFFLMLFAVIALAVHEQPSNCLPGPSTCDTTAHPYGCTKLAMKYATIIQANEERSRSH